jgi:hypothetical protein
MGQHKRGCFNTNELLAIRRLRKRCADTAEEKKEDEEFDVHDMTVL